MDHMQKPKNGSPNLTAAIKRRIRSIIDEFAQCVRSNSIHDIA